MAYQTDIIYCIHHDSSKSEFGDTIHVDLANHRGIFYPSNTALHSDECVALDALAAFLNAIRMIHDFSRGRITYVEFNRCTCPDG